MDDLNGKLSVAYKIVAGLETENQCLHDEIERLNNAPDWEGISGKLAGENERLREQIVEGDREFIKLEQEVVRLREALETIRDNSAYGVGIDHQDIAKDALGGNNGKG